MGEFIVSCPSCGKKFRIQEGAPPGQFQCTSCSATVSYGAPAAAAPPKARPAKARPAQARPAKAAPAAGGAGRARPAAARAPAGRAPRRGGARARRGRYADEEGPPPKSNAPLFIVLGIAAVVVVGGVLAFVLMQDDKPSKPKPTDVASGTQPGGPGAGTQPVAPEPAPGPGPTAPQPGTGPTEPGPSLPPSDGPTRPPSDGPSGTARTEPSPEDGGSRAVTEEIPAGQLFGQKRFRLRMEPYEKLVVDLDHFDDTPDELKTEIDGLCKVIVDFNAGGDTLDARTRLREIGRPALPKIISAFIHAGDTGTPEGVANACFVDGTLREIVGDRVRDANLKPMARPSKAQIQKAVKEWYIWWYSEGYLLKDVSPPDEGEDEEEDG
jgi:hypothetical protein